MTVTCTIADNIAEVVMHNPPVNAITVGDTWKIHDIFKELSENKDLRAVILTALGKGFNAGIDIKEMQANKAAGDEWKLMTSSGEACYHAFHAIYETPVPVIAAVNDFCMGLGVGLVGSCDMIVASTKARFGLPEVDNGALGCASHLAKLVSPMKLREMSLTCKPATAAELHAWGSVAYLTEPDELMAKARELARQMAAKPAAAVRFAKAALNHLDVFEMHTNYRMEQGYTYQLNIMGEGSKARNAFVEGTRIITRGVSGMLLDGKVALVTGAARGIGAATARLLAAEGARVVVADRREDEAGAVVAELNQVRPGSALFVALDVTAEADWQAAIEKTEAAFGPIQVLVNNAGIIRVAPLEQMTLENFRKVIDTNLVGTFLGLKYGAESLKRAGGGSIVNFSSVQGMEGRQGFTAYSASKFGIRGLTKSAAIELGPHNIRVNAVVPGPTKTKMIERPGWKEEDYDAMYGKYPLSRMANADEVARMVLFLASDQSSFCTGGDYVVDGGTLAGKPRE